MITVGQQLPNATINEYLEVATEGCAIGPNAFEVNKLTAGKKIVIFGLPGAFTPTCSAKHVPGYVTHAAELKAKGVDEVWCVAVNDAFVMGAWGKDQQVNGKVRMMADGSGELTKKLGLELDLTGRGMGIRSNRYMMIVDNGVVKHLAVEGPGQFEVSDAASALKAL